MPYSEDEQDSQNVYVTQNICGQTLSKAELRKTNKPIMEKKRRARINRCLNELKDLLLDAMKKDPARHSKLEKADILELTVQHLQTIQRQQLATAVSADPAVMLRFRAGFGDCAQEVKKYISRLADIPQGLKHRLGSHLSSCISGIDRLGPISNDYSRYVANIDQISLDDTRRQSAFQFVKSVRPSPPISPVSCDSACDSSTEPETPPRSIPVFLPSKTSFPTPPSKSASDQDSSPETQKQTVSSTTISPEALKQMETKNIKHVEPLSIVIDVENYRIGIDASPKRPVDYTTNPKLKRTIEVQPTTETQTKVARIVEPSFKISSDFKTPLSYTTNQTSIKVWQKDKDLCMQEREKIRPTITCGDGAFKLVRTDEHAFKILRSDATMEFKESQTSPQNLVLDSKSGSSNYNALIMNEQNKGDKVKYIDTSQAAGVKQNLSKNYKGSPQNIEISNISNSILVGDNEAKLNRENLSVHPSFFKNRTEIFVGINNQINSISHDKRKCSESSKTQYQQTTCPNPSEITDLNQYQQSNCHNIRTVDIRTLQKPQAIENYTKDTIYPKSFLSNEALNEYNNHISLHVNDNSDLQALRFKRIVEKQQNTQATDRRSSDSLNFVASTRKQTLGLSKSIGILQPEPVRIVPAHYLENVKQPSSVENLCLPKSTVSVLESSTSSHHEPESKWNSHVKISTKSQSSSTSTQKFFKRIESTTPKTIDLERTHLFNTELQLKELPSTSSKCFKTSSVEPKETSIELHNSSKSPDSAKVASSYRVDTLSQLATHTESVKELAEADTSSKSPERSFGSGDGMWRPW